MDSLVLNLFFIAFSHAIPLISIIFYKMDIANIVVIYWVESLLIYIFCSLRMKALKLYCQKVGIIPHEDTVDDYFSTQNGHKPPVLSYHGKNSSILPSGAEFDNFIKKLLFPNKLFLIVHGFILIYIVGVGLKFTLSLQHIYTLAIAFFLFTVRQTFSYNAYVANPDMQKVSSFKQLHRIANFRLAGLHLTIIFGVFFMAMGYHNFVFGLLLILWETFTDISAFRYQRKKIRA